MSSTATATGHRKRPKILVVDDSEICRDATRVMLEENGFDVVTLDNQFSFSIALGREKPDLVLVDVNMPAIQGDRLVEVARQYRLHRCPIALYSDRPETELAKLVKSCGASGYIPKTADAKLLVRLIKRLLVGS